MKHSFTKREKMLVFGQPAIGEEEIEAVSGVLRSGWLGTGPLTMQFQDVFRDLFGVNNALATNSCTAALHLSILAAGIGPGHEVITTPMTFCATPNSVIHAGATPVFVDCERDTFNLDPEQIEAAITPRTKAILPVHFAGRPCNMQAILDISRKHNLLVIEDCAHAIESEYHGQKCGTFGEAGCFSFYVTKNVTTVEGGMLISNNQALADKARVLSLHGLSKDAWKRFSDEGYKHYDVTHVGFKYNMTDLNAAIGLCQMERLAGYSERRKEIWAYYSRELRNLPLILPPDPEADTVHARHLYTPLVDIKESPLSRDRLMHELHKRNIGTGVHYLSSHLHSYYQQRFGYRADQFPNAAYISERTFSIPLAGNLEDGDIEDVVAALRDCFDCAPTA